MQTIAVLLLALFSLYSPRAWAESCIETRSRHAAYTAQLKSDPALVPVFSQMETIHRILEKFWDTRDLIRAYERNRTDSARAQALLALATSDVDLAPVLQVAGGQLDGFIHAGALLKILFLAPTDAQTFGLRKSLAASDPVLQSLLDRYPAVKDLALNESTHDASALRRRYEELLVYKPLPAGADSFAVTPGGRAAEKVLGRPELAPQPVACTGGSAPLCWTAPGADWMIGTASMYELRYGTDSIDAGNFLSAEVIPALPAPERAGTRQCILVRCLPVHQTYYFALRSRDEVETPENWSEISNVCSQEIRDGEPLPIEGLPTGTPSVNVVSPAKKEKNSARFSPPNPIRSASVTFPVWAPAGQALFEVFDVNGRRVMKQDLTSTATERQVTWDLGSVRAGVYFMRLTAGPYVVTRKLIVQR